MRDYSLAEAARPFGPGHGHPLGHLRHLRDETGARPGPLVAAIALDAIVFAGFFVYRDRTDMVVIAAFAAFAVVVAGDEHLYMTRSSDGPSSGFTW